MPRSQPQAIGRSDIAGFRFGGSLHHVPRAIGELRACGSSAVTLERADQLTTDGRGAMIDGVWLLPTGISLPIEGSAELPPGAVAIPPGDRILPGQPRQLIVGLEATGNGDSRLAPAHLPHDRSGLVGLRHAGRGLQRSMRR